MGRYLEIKNDYLLLIKDNGQGGFVESSISLVELANAIQVALANWRYEQSPKEEE